VNGSFGNQAAFIGDAATIGGVGGVHIGNSSTSGFDGLGLVVNYGTINTTEPGPGGRGVFLEAGGTVDNSDLIEAIGALGVLVANAPGTITNSGTVVSNVGGGLYYFGVFLAAGGNFTNRQTGIIEGNPGGVAIGGGVGTVINAGYIAATGGVGSVGLDLAGGWTRHEQRKLRADRRCRVRRQDWRCFRLGHQFRND
jgi:hypothetical protein